MSTATSEYTFLLTIAKPENEGFSCLVQYNNIAGLSIYSTNKVYDIYNNIFSENVSLKKIVKNLWKNHQYNQEYTSYLLGQYTDEEFTEIAAKFADPFSYDANKEELINKTKLILSIIDQPLSSADLSVFTDYDVSFIDQWLLTSSESIKLTEHTEE